MADKRPPVVFDDDNPEWTKEDFERARPIDDFPELAAAFPNAGKPRGRPFGTTKSEPKQQVTLRLDQDVIMKFKATGKGWQSRVNDALRRAQV